MVPARNTNGANRANQSSAACEADRFSLPSVDSDLPAINPPQVVAIQQKDAPKLIILDWMMPGIDGIELCRRIRGQNSAVYPYVLLLAAKDAKQDLIRDGGHGELVKKLEELHKSLSEQAQYQTPAGLDPQPENLEPATKP